MKTLGLLLTLLALPLVAANAAQDITALEGALIESTEVSGFAFNQLSPGLRQDINALAGQRLSGELVAELAARIEAERPEVVAAVRGVPRPDGTVRLIFLVARISDDRDLLSNINARYTIEAVEIAGIPESKVSQSLRDDLQALTGQRLDPDEADRLEERLEAELPDFEVRRKISRGTQPGQIRLIFEVSEVEPPPWIPFTPSKSKFVYHSDLGWSGLLDVPMGGRHNRVTLGLAFGNDDDLIEEYSGYGLRFESRKVATERLGVRLELSRFRQSWRQVTLSALESDPRVPEAYRTRVTVEPAVTFAFNRHVRVTAGVSISELESLSRAPESQMASAAQRAAIRADLYLLDVRLPDGNGIDVLRSLRQADDPTPAVMISGHASIRDAVEATRIGAFDFLEKPLARDRVLLVLKNALERSDLQRENQRFRELVGDAPKMIGRSAAFQRAVNEATQVARSDAGVLLTGESGTGKELLAAHIHRESPFASRPFVKVNCAAIPTELIESELFGHEKGAFTGAAAMRRGKFELADGGSIFLDEVGDLHEASQAKLLRVLQDGEFQRLGGEQTIRVSVRVISATNRRLDDLIEHGKFREDLYYRLSVVPIRVPALRERLQDVRELAAYFLAEFCTRNNFRCREIDADVLPILERYSWPGNVRELRNAVERMAILTPGSRITVESIPLEIRLPQSPRPAGLHGIRDSAERDRILQALDETNWNVSGAARLLGIERTNLHKRIRNLGLSREK